MPFTISRIRWPESSHIGHKSDDLSHRVIKPAFPPSGCELRLPKKTEYLFRSTSKNLKLGIGSHKNHPKAHAGKNNWTVMRGSNHSLLNKTYNERGHRKNLGWGNI